MKLSLRKTADIQKALDRVQDKARKRTLDAGDVVAFASRCEDRLGKLGIPKSRRQGTRAEMLGGDVRSTTWALGGGVIARSYKYKYSTTLVTLTRGSTVWTVSGVERIDLYPGAVATDRLQLSNEQWALVAEKHRNINI